MQVKVIFGRRICGGIRGGKRKDQLKRPSSKNQENAKFYLSYRYDDPNIEGRKLEFGTNNNNSTDVIPWRWGYRRGRNSKKIVLHK